MTSPNTTVLQGVPVVPGVRFAPVIRANRLPAIDELDTGAVLAESDRPAEAARFANAASSVAQRLRERAEAVTGAAAEVLGNPSFRYVREIVGPNDAMLEFETEIDGVSVNGIDLIRWDDAGRIVEFKVMVRPLKGIQAVHARMAERLQAGSA